jgi:hypothetical protein
MKSNNKVLEGACTRVYEKGQGALGGKRTVCVLLGIDLLFRLIGCGA